MRHQERAAQVDRDHPVPGGQRHRLERRLVDDAGAVDEDLDRAEPGLDPTDRLRDRIRQGDIAFAGDRVAALRLDLANHSLRVRLVAQMQQADRRALGCERPRDRGADAATAPGDQGDATFQSAV
jgi:hypothetical protein